MSLDGCSFLEKLSEGGLLNGEQLNELDTDEVRKLVEMQFRKDGATLRRVEQLIIRAEAKVSRSELRLLFVFYLELLRQCVVQNSETDDFCSDQTTRQFLLQFQFILTEERADDRQQNWVQLLLGENICKMFVEMGRTAAASSASPFCYEIAKQHISALLANESTRIARRPSIESIAMTLMEMHDIKAISCSASVNGSLFSSLVDALPRAEFFIVVESVSRVLLDQNEIWRDVRTDGQRSAILEKANKTQRIGPAFAALIAKICFAASIDPSDDGFSFKDRHGFSLMLAKLAELLAEDTGESCNLSRKTIFELLGSSSEWNLGLIGPLLPKYSSFYDKAGFSELLRSLFPSLIRRDHQPCADSAISSFVEALFGTDSFSETISRTFDQFIPHLLDSRLSARNFFCTFCKKVQKNDSNSSSILQQLFAQHPNLGVQLANLVSMALIGDRSVRPSIHDQFQWESEHSALELIIACQWIMPHISNQSVLCDFLIRCALNESNSFLCGPALTILCKHFPCQTVKHWQRIYTQNFDSAEVKSDLLSFIHQFVVTLSVDPSADPNSASDQLAIIESANELLDIIEQMLEEEESEQCLQKGAILCTELSKCIPSTDEGQRVRGEQRKMAFQCRQEELARHKQWRRKEQQREDLSAMVETLIPIVNNSCSVSISNGEEAMSKDCY
ncbi:hypothetical protein niasHS_010123 [Heterodera schachtii]|uniref:Uncharacterized protein n=1 Tax=Heterodera schachtii TaxID=97005 RepID=A0ABD2IYS0_HETSC